MAKENSFAMWWGYCWAREAGRVDTHPLFLHPLSLTTFKIISTKQ
jgi:hypothetical protein